VPAPTAATTTNQQATQQSGFTTFGQLRNAVYTTSPGESLPIVQHNAADLHGRVRDAIERSTQLKFKGNIQVGLEGNTLVLAGTVGSERERVLAEAAVRITPGGNRIPLRNDIVVVPLNK
jgi:hypothetical protein